MANPLDPEDLANRFTYHAPKEGQPALYEAIRQHAHDLARHMVKDCPPSRELSLAITALEESVFWANAAVARHG